MCVCERVCVCVPSGESNRVSSEKTESSVKRELLKSKASDDKAFDWSVDVLVGVKGVGPVEGEGSV